MANNFFSFKKFTIYNTESALKVGTDGVLLGAWTDVPANCLALDVGCGTGLIAFMLSQKGATHVDAIDISEEAIRNTEYNILENPAMSNISAVLSSLQLFKTEKKYNLIVCNPPWFVNSLKNANSAKATARHDECLPASELFQSVSSMLDADGCLSIIIPKDLERHYDLCAAQQGFSPQRKLYVRPKPQKDIKRVLIEYKLNAGNCINSELCIENSEDRVFSDDYKNLTREFYLKF